MYLILMRKNINWLKDKGILLSTLIILVFLINFLGACLFGLLRQKKAPSGRIWTGEFKHEKNLLRRNPAKPAMAGRQTGNA
jgi:hypothetical protein